MVVPCVCRLLREEQRLFFKQLLLGTRVGSKTISSVGLIRSLSRRLDCFELLLEDRRLLLVLPRDDTVDRVDAERRLLEL